MSSELSTRDFKRIAKLVHELSGITINDTKRSLIVARLQKRLRKLGLPSFRDYLRHVEDDRSLVELTEMIDAITTNHTWFFREDDHFDFLRHKVVPNLPRFARGWCAACSTGEEPVSIALTLLDAMSTARHDEVRLLASDLSTKALAAARAGVYSLERASQIPPAMLHEHFERGYGKQEGLVRIKPAVRRLLEYQQINLLDISQHGSAFDFIFCRNVMIYFDQAVQQRVIVNLERSLKPGGFLFTSHSESLNRITHELQWVAPAVYQRPAARQWKVAA